MYLRRRFHTKTTDVYLIESIRVVQDSILLIISLVAFFSLGVSTFATVRNFHPVATTFSSQSVFQTPILSADHPLTRAYHFYNSEIGNEAGRKFLQTPFLRCNRQFDVSQAPLTTHVKGDLNIKHVTILSSYFQVLIISSQILGSSNTNLKTRH